VISCGSYTTGASGAATVTLGYEPQWILLKNTTDPDKWYILDNMRGWGMTQANGLYPNVIDAESDAFGNGINPTATGFNDLGVVGTSATIIYIAIRRGPMKVPTSGTSVFAPIAYAGNNTANRVITGLTNAPDWVFYVSRNAAGQANHVTGSRLQGGGRYLLTESTGAEGSSTDYGVQTYGQTSVTLGAATTNEQNATGINYILYGIGRAPSFFDVVCYTGTGVVGRTVTHNLTVVPELMIVKSRTDANSWIVYSTFTGASYILALNLTDAIIGPTTSWNNTAPTSSVFTVNASNSLNGSGITYVAYLFATCAGVSKVGSYTGNGTTQTINCGFTGGARFVLIKRTDSTGDWMVSDSARGIVSGNDPYLELNNTNAEVTGEDWLDTDSTGFVVNEVSGSNANTNDASYIFLAIA
jgi:hypothetical protein